jgi:hypothetical protein
MQSTQLTVIAIQPDLNHPPHIQSRPLPAPLHPAPQCRSRGRPPRPPAAPSSAPTARPHARPAPPSSPPRQPSRQRPTSSSSSGEPSTPARPATVAAARTRTSLAGGCGARTRLRRRRGVKHGSCPCTGCSAGALPCSRWRMCSSRIRGEFSPPSPSASGGWRGLWCSWLTWGAASKLGHSRRQGDGWRRRASWKIRMRRRSSVVRRQGGREAAGAYRFDQRLPVS